MSREWTGNSRSAFAVMGSSSHSDKERQSNDYYATDPIAIDLLINECGVKFDKTVWECACGEGHLSKRLEELGCTVYSTDLIDRGFGIGGIDFLQTTDTVDMDIVTNPPYKYAREFIEHAMEITSPGNKIFMFLKVTFLEGKARKAMFKKYPPKCVYVSSSRILCAKNGDFERAKADGGSAMAFAWYEFENGYQGDTIVKWIN